MFNTPAISHDRADPEPEDEPPAERRRLVRRPAWIENYDRGHSSLKDESSSEEKV